MTRQKKIDLGVKIIRPNRRKPTFENSLEGSLYKSGYAGIPTATKKLYPRVDAKGKIRTGLDPNALRINAMFDKESRQAEIERITQLKNFYESELGEDLSPDSPYWIEVKGESDDPSATGGYYLQDGDNVFDLNNAKEAVTFYWLMETGFIAESIDDIENGKVDSWVTFYVHDEESEDSLEFERRTRINGARAVLESLSPSNRKKIAKILGLRVTSTAKDEKVYTAIDEYLNTPKSQLNLDPVEMFNKVNNYSKEFLDVKSLIIDLVKNNVVRMAGSIVKEGDHVWAKSVEDFELLLLDPSNTEIYNAFKEKIEAKLQIKI